MLSYCAPDRSVKAGAKGLPMVHCHLIQHIRADDKTCALVACSLVPLQLPYLLTSCFPV